MDVRGFTSQILFVLSGLIIWSVHFLVIYPFNALACARGFTAVDVLGVGIVPFTILGVTILALAAIAASAFLAPANRGPANPNGNAANEKFLRGLAIGIALLSSLAIVLETIPVLMIPPCG